MERSDSITACLKVHSNDLFSTTIDRALSYCLVPYKNDDVSREELHSIAPCIGGSASSLQPHPTTHLRDSTA